jgi:hypothetical protein
VFEFERVAPSPCGGMAPNPMLGPTLGGVGRQGGLRFWPKPADMGIEARGLR